jgi:hypothetical protein
MGKGDIPEEVDLSEKRKPLRHVESSSKAEQPSEASPFANVLKSSSPNTVSALASGAKHSDSDDPDAIGAQGLLKKGYKRPSKDEDESDKARRGFPIGKGELPEEEDPEGRRGLRHVSTDDSEDFSDDDDYEYDDDIEQYLDDNDSDDIDGYRASGDEHAAPGTSNRILRGDTKRYQRQSKDEAEASAPKGRNFVVGKGELPPEEVQVDWNAEMEKNKRRLRKTAAADGSEPSGQKSGKQIDRTAPEWLAKVAARKKKAAAAALKKAKAEEHHIYDEYNPRKQGFVVRFGQ